MSDKPRPILLEMLAIAAPVVATMTSYTLMQFVDKLMVSRLDSDPVWVGAQGNGGLAAWIPISVIMGFVTVINTFVSQNLGAGTPRRGSAYAWAGMWMSVAYWAAVLVPIALALPWILSLARGAGLSGEELARAVRRDELGASYGRILLLGAVLTLACRALSQFFYGMHKAGVVLIATVAGNVTNLVLNGLFVFGPTPPAPTGHAWIDGCFSACAAVSRTLGIPRLELDGAAIGTVIGTGVELLIPVLVFASAKYRREFHTLSAWRPSVAHMKDLFRIGWAPSLMFGNEMICWGFFMVHLVGQFGTLHSTAGWIAHQWMSLSFMPAVGISVAITAMVGKQLGAGKPAEASRRAWIGLMVAAGYMSLCGVAFLVFRRQLVEVFVQNGTLPAERAEIVSLGATFIVAAACFQLFDGVAMSVMGALKGAGDTKFPGLVTLGLSWTLIVGGGMAMVKWMPQLGSLGPWVASAAYIITLSCVLFTRFVSGGWKKRKLLEESAGSVG